MPDLILSPQQKIHYLDPHPQGSPCVLLLHGLGVNGDSWQLQIPDLVAHGYRVLAPDARGFGHSTFPGGRTSIAGMAMDFAALLEALETGPAYVVGISMGGTHALQLALDFPQLVRKLVLVNTFARLNPASPRGWLYFIWRFILIHTVGLPAQARAVAWNLFPRADQEIFRRELISQIMLADPRGYRAAMRALVTFNVEARLREIRIPTLVITAANDKTIPASNQQALVRGISGARQVIVQNANHAVIIDQPQEFNSILINFLQE